MQTDTATQLSRTTVILHWLVGVTMITLLAVGVYMAETKTYALYPWHKSFGVLIFTVVLLRVAWRLKNGWPTPVSHYQRIEHILAKVVHWVLIIGSLCMPISGFMMSSIGGHGVELFGLELVARNPDPANPKKVLAHNADIAAFAHAVHHWLGYIVIGALVLHIVGAFKHHLVDKDGTLRRMLGARV